MFFYKYLLHKSLRILFSNLVGMAERFEAIIGGTNDCRTSVMFCKYYFVFDANDLLISASKQFYENFGIFSESIIGKSFIDVFSKIDSGWRGQVPEVISEIEGKVLLRYDVDGIGCTFSLTVDLLSDLSIVLLQPDIDSDYSACKNLRCKAFEKYAEGLDQFAIKVKEVENELSCYQNNFNGVLFKQFDDLNFVYLSNKQKTAFDKNFHGIESNFLNFLYEDDVDLFFQKLQLCRKTKSTVSVCYRIKDLAGNITYVLDIRTPYYCEDGSFAFYNGILIDNTRLSVAEKRISQLSWKSQTCLISAGLVHDFSNVMTGIFSLSELYCSKLDSSNALYTGLQAIKTNSQEARKLIRRLIELNKEEPERKTYQNLTDLIKNQYDFIKVIFPKNSKIEIDCPNKEMVIYVDAVEFRQMLLNLAINAKDACQDTPFFKISVKYIKTGDLIFDKIQNEKFVAQNDFAEICFTDNGEGISSDCITKIFEAFFTTKGFNNGSGIGLYNVKSFVESNGGKITVTSKLKQGTSFYVCLPLITEDNNCNHCTTNSTKCAFENKLNTRPSVLIYAKKNPCELELTKQLIDKQLEVIGFNNIASAKKFINESKIKPNVVITVELGEDSNTQKILEFCRKNFNEINLVLYSIGKNIDEITQEQKNSVSLLISDCQGSVCDHVKTIYNKIINIGAT